MTTEYDSDFYAWLMKNARLLRDRQFAEVDSEHVAEELESMGRHEKRALISRLTVLLAHLLKWQYQPARRCKSWRNTISTQRMDISELLQDSPSLRYALEERVASAYEKAKLSAEDETGISQESFPSACPFTLTQLLDRAFFPEN